MWKAEDPGFQCMLLPSRNHLCNLHSHILLLSSDLEEASEAHVYGHLKEDSGSLSETLLLLDLPERKGRKNLDYKKRQKLR